MHSGLGIHSRPLRLNKTRRLTRTTRGGRPHAAVIDHHTRSVMIDGSPWQGAGLAPGVKVILTPPCVLDQ
jgi:hypothetical protein